MFFIGILGTGTRKNRLGEVFFSCTGCIGEKFTLVEFYKSFDIFFIPIMKLKKSYIIECSKCHSIYSVKPESIGNILKTKKVGYDDIDKIIYEGSSCPKCGRTLLEKFIYCPFCGEKLK